MKRALLFSCVLLATVPVLAVAQSGNVIYEYDALGRLVSTEYPSGVATDYTYDDAGNRLSVTTGSNAPPNAVNDSYNQDASTTSDYDVLANDTDPNNDTLILASVSGAGASIVSNRLRYTAPSSAGNYTVSYTAADGNGGTASATATVTVSVPAPVLVLTAGGSAISPYYREKETEEDDEIEWDVYFLFNPQNQLVVEWIDNNCQGQSLRSGYSYTGNGCEIQRD